MKSRGVEDSATARWTTGEAKLRLPTPFPSFFFILPSFSILIMYGLPETEDLDFLIGRELDQVCVSQNQQILNFDEHVSISMECKFTVDSPDDGDTDSTSVRSMPKCLIDLLGRQIRAVSKDGAGGFIIELFGGYVLHVFDSNANYESYGISAPGRHIIV